MLTTWWKYDLTITKKTMSGAACLLALCPGRNERTWTMNRQPSWSPDTGGAEAVTLPPQMPSDISTLSFEALKDLGAVFRAQLGAASVPGHSGVVVTTIEGLSRSGAALALEDVMSALLGHERKHRLQ